MILNAGAVVVLPDGFTVSHRGQIAELAARHRLPAMLGLRSHVVAGGLMAYGASAADMYRQAASYVDKIFKGAKPVAGARGRGDPVTVPHSRPLTLPSPLRGEG